MPRTELSTAAIRDIVLREPIFTSRDVAVATGASAVAISKLMRRLTQNGVVTRIMRGLWANPAHTLFTPYLVIGRLAETWGEPAYVSFISALHLHGMLSQIPRENARSDSRATCQDEDAGGDVRISSTRNEPASWR